MKSGYERKAEKRTSYTIEDIGNYEDLMLWRIEREVFENAYKMQADRRLENAKRFAAKIVAMEIAYPLPKANEVSETNFIDDNKIDLLNEKRLSPKIEAEKSYMFPESDKPFTPMSPAYRMQAPKKSNWALQVLKTLIFG